eukprot:jgi/Mesvir1/17703/Mv18985-RA.4
MCEYQVKHSFDPSVTRYLNAVFGEDHVTRICEALSRPPVNTYIRVNLCATTRESLEERLTAVFGKEHSVSKHPQLDNVLVVQGSGPHPIRLESVSPSLAPDGTAADQAGDKAAYRDGQWMVVSRKCAEAVLRGSQIFVPGVLACSPGVMPGDRVLIYTDILSQDDPPGKVEEGAASTDNGQGQGPRLFPQLLRGTKLRTGPPGFGREAVVTPPGDGEGEGDPASEVRGRWDSMVCVGRGTALLSRADMFISKKGVAVEMSERVFRLPPTSGLFPGEMFIQSLPSILAAKVLGAQPGERILDMCAAPGGKTTAIAESMRNEGTVVALDRSHSKINDLMALAESLGLTIIKAYKMDATKAVMEPEPCAVRADSGGGAPKADGGGAAASDTSHMGTGGGQLMDGGGGGSHDGANGANAGRGASDASAAGGVNGASDGSAACAASLVPDWEDADDPSVGEPVNCVQARKERVRQKRGEADWKGTRKARVGLGFPPNSFDRVLLDAPCTALGLRPRLVINDTSLKDLCMSGLYQRKLIEAAVRLLKPGGTLVFSTWVCHREASFLRHFLSPTSCGVSFPSLLVSFPPSPPPPPPLPRLNPLHARSPTVSPSHHPGPPCHHLVLLQLPATPPFTIFFIVGSQSCCLFLHSLYWVAMDKIEAFSKHALRMPHS